MASAQSDPPINGHMLFSLLQKYQSSFQDVSFIHEGTLEMLDAGSGKTESTTHFQTFYAYRYDGATVLDSFSQSADNPKVRVISSILHNRSEVLDATPDRGPPVGVRTAESRPGGPGSLVRYDSPERIFLPWYFSTLGDALDHDFKSLGWEDRSGHRCLRVSMLRRPKTLLKGWVGGLPYIHLWIDLQRDGYPIRYEYYRGEELETRGEVTRMERLQLPDGRPIWFPAEGRTWGFLGKGESGGLVRKKDPSTTETHRVLINTVKFNQGFNDAFFSVKKHALVASDEGLRKLQRELEAESAVQVKADKLANDPESRRKRLDLALEEAERQAKGLEASSAARSGAGWFDVLNGGLAVSGVILLCVVTYWRWKTR
jgi:hypothetical protein